jgi:hypothetical protein
MSSSRVKKLRASYSTTNKMHLLSEIIYSCKTLYMFRTVVPSIIRSSKLRIQQLYMSNSCCCLLLSGMSSISSPIAAAVWHMRCICFERLFRPSSGAQNCVYSNGICQTLAATCCYLELHLITDSSNCLTYTVAVYAVLSSWWWTERPKHVERFTRISNSR